jgi:hypothetical protein
VCGQAAAAEFFMPLAVRLDPNDSSALICSDSRSLRRIKDGALPSNSTLRV